MRPISGSYSDGIPLERRWKFATDMIQYLPLIYENAFRKHVGFEYDALERECFADLAIMGSLLAEEYYLPVDSARSLGWSMWVIMLSLFGPDFENEILEATDERVVMRMTRCPIMKMAENAGFEVEHSCNTCKAFNKTLLRELNPGYSLRYSHGMCWGDEYCEIILESRDSLQL